MNGNSIDLNFTSCLDYLDIVQEVSDGIGKLMGFDADGCYWISLSVRESVTNAILHGNKRDVAKRVGLSFMMDEGRLQIAVTDEGNGFDESQLPDPLEPANLLKPSGRGIFYVRSFMDEVRYRALPEGGWQMIMEKRLNHNQQGDGDDN